MRLFESEKLMWSLLICPCIGSRLINECLARCILRTKYLHCEVGLALMFAMMADA